MDPAGFDQLTIALSRGLTRRALAAFGGLLMGGAVTGRMAAQEDCGCYEGETCRDGHCFTACATNRDCRSRQNDDPCVLNSCVDGICVSAIVDCQPGYECCYGECCNKRCATDAECAVFDPCRIGACQSGVCVFTQIDPCNPCVSDADCLANGMNTQCCSGSCRRPCPDGLVMGKGCECVANADGTGNGLIVRDDESG